MRLQTVDDKTGVRISTVLLPFTHNGGIYETCIFDEANRGKTQVNPLSPLAKYASYVCPSEVVARYYTQAQAEAGHEEWVKKVAAKGYEAVNDA